MYLLMNCSLVMVRNGLVREVGGGKDRGDGVEK